jgi:hypothetical protein
MLLMADEDVFWITVGKSTILMIIKHNLIGLC